MASDDTSAPSRGERFFKLAKMTASVAGNYASSRVKSFFQSEEDAEQSLAESDSANGALVAETLGELKGAVMKFGQMASLTEDLLPSEIAEPLKSLQNEAPAMDYEVIAEQIESEFDVSPDRLFDEFETEPFASASIGQVHRAVTDDGRDAVVKVQYPGVDESCDSDLAQLRFALKVSGFVKSSHEEAFDDLFEEMRERLHEELDYCNEADNVRRFNEIHSDDPWIITPEVIGERSSKRVLTLTYEDGDDLETAAQSYPKSARNKIGANLLRTFAKQLLEHGVIHADPNPANYAFREDGRFVLYDYGCIKEVPQHIITPYKELLHAGFERNFSVMDEKLFELGARVEEGPPVHDEFYKKWHDLVLAPLIQDEYFNYGRSTINRDVKQHLVKIGPKYVDSFKPPRHLALIDRTAIGMHNNLRKLESVLPWRSIMKEYLYG